MKKWIIISCVILICAVSLIVVSNYKCYSSWHLNDMQIDKLWEYSQGNSQTIAFIDTGLSEDLLNYYDNRIIACWNVIDNNADVQDKHGHGTEMVSVACGDGYLGQYGISPQCRIIIIKAVSDSGITNNEYLYDALLYAHDSGATIINISLGGYATDNRVVTLVQELIDEGIIIVASAGDYGHKDLLFPANIPGVISVEALDRDHNLWNYSNHSDSCVVRAPGVDIQVLSLDGNNTVLATASGTSQSTAIMSGYISLVLDYAGQNDISLANSEVISLLGELNTKTEEISYDYVSIFEAIKD